MIYIASLLVAAVVTGATWGIIMVVDALIGLFLKGAR